ncbi:hypothetical protein STEG23_014226 [Scotinomys teguina]
MASGDPPPRHLNSVPSLAPQCPHQWWMKRSQDYQYLLAMVIAYFSRAGLFSWQFRPIHFFLALYLANDMEEDNQAPKQDMFYILYGKSYIQRPMFHKLRFQLIRSMGWRTWVSREECEELVSISLYPLDFSLQLEESQVYAWIPELRKWRQESCEFYALYPKLHVKFQAGLCYRLKLSPVSDQTKPNQTKPNQTKPNQTKPNQTKPNQTKPNQTKPNQTKPNQTKPYSF